MNITDWDEWMKKRHIKLRGNDNDNRSDEKCTGSGIFRTDLETESKRNGRPSSDSNLQEHGT